MKLVVICTVLCLAVLCLADTKLGGNEPKITIKPKENVNKETVRPKRSGYYPYGYNPYAYGYPYSNYYGAGYPQTTTVLVSSPYSSYPYNPYGGYGYPGYSGYGYPGYGSYGYPGYNPYSVTTVYV
ncbi:uncharacterized protein [Diabrotica undecimpunctata]|uniref:uncharacterized protein n=1 Tax=Diabrotica undecimpunctata TaxID=50387 RepID=UPI003B6399DE